LQIGDVLNWIALPQFVIVPLAALVLRWIDARLLLAIGFALIAVGSWIDTGLTHDLGKRRFPDLATDRAVGLALSITALITFTIANVTPRKRRPSRRPFRLRGYSAARPGPRSRRHSCGCASKSIRT